MSQTAETTAEIDLENRDFPETINGWNKVIHNNTRVEWWRQETEWQRYTAIGLFQGGDVLKVTEKRVGKYGYVENSYTQTVNNFRFYDPEEAFNKAMDTVRSSINKKEEGNESVLEKPSVPETMGSWENITSTHWRYRWRAAPGTEIITLKTGFRNIGTRTKAVFDTIIRINDTVVNVFEQENHTSAVQRAVTVMDAFPDAEFEEVFEELQSVKGIGPVKAQQLATLGITSIEELRRKLTTPEKVMTSRERESLEKIVTNQIRNSVTND